MGENESALEGMSSMIAQLESRLVLPSGFFWELLRGDDWSFVVKTHALLEAVVSQVLVHSVGDERLSESLYRLPLSTKLNMSKSLGVSSAQAKFVDKISALRNQLVHRVENVGFDFGRYVQALDAGAKSSWESAILQSTSRPVPTHWTNRVWSKPRSTIWVFSLVLVTDLLGIITTARAQREYVSRKAEMLDTILSSESFGLAVGWDDRE